MIVKQSGLGIIMLGKMDNIKTILEEAIKIGYGKLPAYLSVKLYLERN